MHPPVSTVFAYLYLYCCEYRAFVLYFSRPFADRGAILLVAFSEALSVRSGCTGSALGGAFFVFIRFYLNIPEVYLMVYITHSC